MRCLIAAMVIDCLGSGLFGPFVLLFGNVVVGLSLPSAGAGIAVAGTVALALGPPAGAALDHFGPGRLLVIANLFAAVGDLALLAAHGIVTFTLASLLELAAARVFWAGFGPLVGRLVEESEQERWFGKLRGIRYVGLALGGALASLVLTLGERRGLRLMLIIDAVTFVVAAALTAAATRSIGPSPDARRHQRDKEGYAAVLADRGNTALALLNVSCTLSIVAPVIALPVYILGSLHGERWLPGAVAAATTVALAVAVTVSHRITRGRSRLTVLAAANVLWAVSSCALAGAASGARLRVAMLFGAAGVMGLAEGTYAPTADVVPLVLAEPHLTGRYAALHQMGWGVSNTVAPLLVGVLLARGPLVLWVVLGVLALLTALGYVALRPALETRLGRSGTASTSSVESPQPV